MRRAPAFSFSSTAMLPPLYILVAFAAFWCLLSLLISAMGWMGLVKRYRTGKRGPGPVYWLEGGDIGARYRGALVFGIQPDGLRMSVLFPFRVGHPPLLIPWSDIEAVEEKKVLFGHVVVFRVGKPYGTTMELSGDISRAICDALEAVAAGEIPRGPRGRRKAPLRRAV